MILETRGSTGIDPLDSGILGAMLGVTNQWVLDLAAVMNKYVEHAGVGFRFFIFPVVFIGS